MEVELEGRDAARRAILASLEPVYIPSFWLVAQAQVLHPTGLECPRQAVMTRTAGERVCDVALERDKAGQNRVESSGEQAVAQANLALNRIDSCAAGLRLCDVDIKARPNFMLFVQLYVP